MKFRSANKSDELRAAVAKAYPKAENDSYMSFRIEDEAKRTEETNIMPGKSIGTIGESNDSISGNSFSSLPVSSSLIGGQKSSMELISLFPSGIGLKYNNYLKIYELAESEKALDQSRWSSKGFFRSISSGDLGMFFILFHV